MSQEELDGQRFDAQCLLTQMWYNKKKELQWSPKGGLRGGNSALKHVKVLKGDSELIVNMLTGQPKEWHAFSNIKSQQMAFMTPMIRLWKANHKRKGKDVEFFFEKGSYTFEKGSIRSIFKNKDTRGTDVGIDSVDIEFLATQPAEVMNHISLKLVLFFQNFDSLVKTRHGPGGEEYHYSDLILRSLSGAQAKQFASKKCATAGGLPYVPTDYEIKLQIGWNPMQFGTYISSSSSTKLVDGVVKFFNKLAKSDNDAMSQPNLKALGFDEGKELRKVIRSSSTMLHCTLKNHTFNFNMDGSFTLDIEYHASIRGGASSGAGDIFYNKMSAASSGGPPRDRIKEMAQAARKREADRAKRKSATKAPGGKSKPKNPNEEEENEQEEQAQQKLLMSKIQAYRRVFVAIEKNAQALAIPKGAIGEMTSGESTVSSANQCLKYHKIAGATAMGPHLKSTEDAYEQKTKMSKRMGDIEEKGDIKEFSEDVDEDELEEADVSDQMEAKAKAAGFEPDFVMIHYVYFGHIVDAVYDLLASNNNPRSKEWNRQNRNVRYLLGPAIAENPCAGFNKPVRPGIFAAATMSAERQVREEGCGPTPADWVKGLELYNLPILWEQFGIWFKNNVIKQQLESYDYQQFLQDCFSSLVMPSLGSNCNKFIKNAPPKLEFTTVDLGELPPGNDIFRANYKDNAKVSISSLMKAVHKNRYSKQHKGPVSKNSMNSIIVMYLLPQQTHRRISKAQDQKDGVYWIELGKGNGTIINYSFSKNDAPYLAEAKTLGNGALGADLAGGGIYNFSCEMMGNGFFKPGQLIFVDPSQLQRHRASAVSIQELRVGGYYVIDTVKMSLKNGEFITSFEATWSGPGIGGARSSVSHLKRTPDEKKAVSQEVTRIAGKGMSKYIYNSGGSKTKTKT